MQSTIWNSLSKNWKGKCRKCVHKNMFHTWTILRLRITAASSESSISLPPFSSFFTEPSTYKFIFTIKNFQIKNFTNFYWFYITQFTNELKTTKRLLVKRFPTSGSVTLAYLNRAPLRRSGMPSLSLRFFIAITKQPEIVSKNCHWQEYKVKRTKLDYFFNIWRLAFI